MAACKQTIVNPDTGRCIVVGGRTYKKLEAEKKITGASALKEVVKETIIAQKSPVRLASPAKIAAVAAKKKKSPKKSPKKTPPKKTKLSPIKERTPKKLSPPKKIRAKKLASSKY